MSTSTDETIRRALAQRQLQLKSTIEGMLAHPVEELQAELDEATKLLDGTDWTAPVMDSMIAAAAPQAAKVGAAREAAVAEQAAQVEKMQSAPISINTKG